MTEYMKFLRAHIGHAPVLQVGASVILERENGDVLMQLRRDNGCWGYHGGSVDAGEAVEVAAARELFEETGLICDELELLGVFSGPELHYVYPNGDIVDTIDCVYVCRKFHGEIKMQEEEVAELRYFALDNIPENLSPPNIPAMRYYVEKRKELLNG